MAEPVEDWVAARALVSDLREACVACARAGRFPSGLAAPQLGVSVRLFVVVTSRHGDPISVAAFCNPTVLATSDDEDSEFQQEGCLSFEAGAEFGVFRPRAITLAWENEFGTSKKASFVDWDARVRLHELDHLDGILISDYKDDPWPRLNQTAE